MGAAVKKSESDNLPTAKKRKSHSVKKIDLVGAAAKKSEADNLPIAEKGKSRAVKKIVQISKTLKPFLEANPWSSIEELTLTTGKAICIKKPWGDDSLALALPEAIDSFAVALNGVVLPERFSAIWHREAEALEVIWTANPLPLPWQEVHGRKFLFRSDSSTNECEFARSSDCLSMIASNFVPIVSSGTYHRNLTSFRNKGRTLQDGTEPRSFWIRNLKWDENKVLELVKNLNFYMSYYDSISPTVLVHTPKSESEGAKPQTRYRVDKFPKQIDWKPIDDTLLQLWHASRSNLNGDSASRFINLFRVIEYASYSYLEVGVRSEIRKLLSSPHRLHSLGDLTESIAAALQKSKLEDYQRCESLLRDTVKPTLLWREINRNIKAFSTDTEFDGGFRVNKLVSAGGREEDFTPNAIVVFHRAIREIRNALAHGKDLKTALVITPTTHNLEKLSPWVSLLSVAAAEVILYKDVV